MGKSPMSPGWLIRTRDTLFCFSGQRLGIMPTASFPFAHYTVGQWVLHKLVTGPLINRLSEGDAYQFYEDDARDFK